MVIAGGASKLAAGKVAHKLKTIAAQPMEADPQFGQGEPKDDRDQNSDAFN